MSDPQLVVDYAEAAEILTSAAFAQCGHNGRREAPVTSDTLISLHGEPHFDRRRLESTLFRKALLHSWESVDLAAALTAELTRWRQDADGPWVTVELLTMTRRALLPVTAVLIGLDEAARPDQAAELDHFAEVFAPAAALRTMPAQDQDRIRRDAEQAQERFHREVFLPAWQRRLERPAGPGAPTDLLTALALHLRDLPTDQVLREVLLFIVASTDTTTMAVASTFFHVARWLEAHPQDAPRRTDVEFLQACAHEAIRLYPPPPLDRVALSEGQLRSGRAYRAGDRFAVSLAAANRDEAVFGPDAAEYDPHRVTPGKVRPYGLGFGGGPHMCIGRMMATATNRLEAPDLAGDTVGTALRILLRLFAEDAHLDPDDPPVWRTGSTQDRFTRFPVVIRA
jgi:cytochrome P450